MFVLMLDWQGLPIELFPTEEDPNKRYIRVDETLIVASLVVKQTRPFNSKEAAIRNTFDVLFKWLERFDQYIESGLVKYSDFHPYLRYWLSILADARSGLKTKELCKAVHTFLDAFGYEGVLRLMKRWREAEAKRL